MYSDEDSRSPWPHHAESAKTPSVSVRSQSADSRAPVTSAEVDAGYAAYELRRILAKIDQARDEQALFWLSNTAFGPNSFCSRLGEALGNTAFYLPLLKLFVQSELEDRLSGRVDWPPVGNRSLGFGGPELWEVGHHLRYARINLLCDQGPLKKAAETRAALLSELIALFTDTEQTFAEIRAKLAPHTREHWLRYLEKVKSPKGQADAGWSLGMVLAETLGAIASMLKQEESFARISSAAPVLMDFATALKQ